MAVPIFILVPTWLITFEVLIWKIHPVELLIIRTTFMGKANTVILDNQV